MASVAGRGAHAVGVLLTVFPGRQALCAELRCLLPKRVESPCTALSSILFLLLLALSLSSCDMSAKTRPPGLFRLGKVSELKSVDQRAFPEFKIVLFHDQRGFYAMSTACTYDLSPLVRSGQSGGDEHWRSMYTSSEYGLDGRVRKGPARADLPFYELRFAAGAYGGVADTLFVMVGVPRPREWRLSDQ